MSRYLSFAIVLALVAADGVALAAMTGPCNITVVGGTKGSCNCLNNAGTVGCTGGPVVNTSTQKACANTNEESCTQTAVPISTSYSCGTSKSGPCSDINITFTWSCFQDLTTAVTTPGGTNC
jgi:hypothetical protein